MKTKIHWIVGSGLPEHSAILEAVPGVGNVGKIVVDALVEKHPSRTIGWILHPDFPPHATLSNNGLLAPPRLEINSVLLPDGKTVITIGGDLQPMTANGQYEVAESILELAKKNNIGLVYINSNYKKRDGDDSYENDCEDQCVEDSRRRSDCTSSQVSSTAA